MISRRVPNWREQDAEDKAPLSSRSPVALRGQSGGLPPEILECLLVGYRHGCRLDLYEAQRLAQLRERYRAGEASEYYADARWQFARWLYQHGRLSG